MSGVDFGDLKMRWSSGEPAETVEDRKISRLAVASLLLGLLSWLAFLHPAMWSVPALGVVLAVFALRAVARQPALYSGRRVALVGLTLSLFCLSFAPSRHVTREHRLFQEGERVGRKWIELVCAGQLQEAHQLRLPVAKRVAVDDSLDHYYKDDTHKMDFEQFKIDPLVKQLAGDTRPGAHNSDEAPVQIRLDANISQTAGADYQDIVTQRYIVERKINRKTEIMTIRLVMSRTATSLSREGQWMVLDSSSVF